jgi:large subunit ribosomal protein LX
MKAFKVSGSFKKGKRERQKFRIEVAAENEEAATQKVLSTLGSRHRLNRKEISIDEMAGISGDEITNQVVRYLTEGSR